MGKNVKLSHLFLFQRQAKAALKYNIIKLNIHVLRVNILKKSLQCGNIEK